MQKLFCHLVLLASSSLSAADYPQPVERDFVLRDFRFAARTRGIPGVHRLRFASAGSRDGGWRR